MRDAGAPSGGAVVRPCRSDEVPVLFDIINSAAKKYDGVIPADCWHDPYMSMDQLAAEIAAGVVFTGCEIDGVLGGVMGFQHIRDVDLIRHAYVSPQHQGRGVGGMLLRHLEAESTSNILIGTWADASWAIAFYQRHGYRLTSPEDKVTLLKTYWTVSDRQIEASVVLTKPAMHGRAEGPAAN